MLDLQVTIQGDRVVVANLQRYARELPHAVDRGLKRVVRGLHRLAYEWLSAAGAMSASNVVGTFGFTKKSGEAIRHDLYGDAGGYPVPVRTGHLRRMLDWLDPGESKTGEAGAFTAGPHEVVLFDSAIYAGVIHEGSGSSAKFGPRRYAADALERFNQGSRIVAILEEEIGRELK